MYYHAFCVSKSAHCLAFERTSMLYLTSRAIFPISRSQNISEWLRSPIYVICLQSVWPVWYLSVVFHVLGSVKQRRSLSAIIASARPWHFLRDVGHVYFENYLYIKPANCKTTANTSPWLTIISDLVTSVRKAQRSKREIGFKGSLGNVVYSYSVLCHDDIRYRDDTVKG